MHNILRYTNSLEIGQDDRLTLLQTPAFSGAVSSMFCALLNGAAVFPLNPRHESSPSLARWLRENQLTMWDSVPSLFRELCSGGGEFPSVRVIRLEGDRAAISGVGLFRRHFSKSCLLVNGLGATETGISRQYFVTHDSTLEGKLLPVGYAVPDMRVTVVDGTGEIVVQSRFFAQGYWQRPDLTARAFRDCGDGLRVYRTGDLGRLRADGCLEHLGRLDSRVKIRGQWVDLAAVEALVQQASGVAECALRLDAGAGGEHRLASWYAAELLRVQPHGPIALTGLRFGGCVAYEMACQLAAQGRTVQTLVLIECFNSRWLATQSLLARLRARTSLAARRAVYHAAAIVRLGPRDASRHIRQRIVDSQAGGQSAAIARANRAAERGWTPQPNAGRVLLLVGWFETSRRPIQRAPHGLGRRGLLAAPAVHAVAERFR